MPIVALIVLAFLLLSSVLWIGGLVWAVAVPVVIGGGVVVGAIAWCVWWCLDPKGAGEAFREAERAQARRKQQGMSGPPPRSRGRR
ncbi:MAG: hypothetical protein A2790_20085 [Phenylobacterium sp. RIFCSPHIGHO2_01_FULL_69_31]|nr:MAG: hypothetical protein A2790_20085 [Phenylobacterium sp. RIFCSPHIGHO2_01_FULL_69_31]